MKQVSTETPRLLIVGIGNDFRGDDGAGLEVARQIRAAPAVREWASSITVREDSGDVASLIEAWDGFDAVFVADAVAADASPGAVVRFDARKEAIPRIFAPHVSSHGAGVAEALSLAEALGRLPARLLVYGVVGANFEPGAPMTPAVLRGIEETVVWILRDLSIAGDSDRALEGSIRDA